MKLGSSQTAGGCCCDELRLIHKAKEDDLVKISDAWKLKTYTLASDFFKRLQSVREENTQLKLQAFESIDKMRQYQHHTVEQILSRQEDLVLTYERKLKKLEKENKSLNKRVVQHRHNMITKK